MTAEPAEPSTALDLIDSLATGAANAVGIRSRLLIEAVKLAALGTGFALANAVRARIIEFLLRNITVVAEFDSRDEAYTWLLAYLSESSLAKTTSRFSVATSVSARQGSAAQSQHADDAANFGFNMPRVFFLPSPGDHIFPFNGRLLYISRSRSAFPTIGSPVNPIQPPSERLTITLLGRSRAPLINLIQSAARAYIAKEKGRTVVFAADQYGNWRRTRSRPVRPLESVVMEPGVKLDVLRDVVEFLSSEGWYANRGIPYRRGYLFYGPPGTGKTSFVSALAGSLRLDIYVISLSNGGLTDDNLIELMSMTPARCVLLLEDVDAAFVSRETGSSGNEGKAGGSLTFSGLLNAIDGVAAQEGRILCMTTNHVDRLDPALIRPGRIDVQVLFDKASKWQAAELFKKFYGGVSAEDIEASRIARGIVEGCSPDSFPSSATPQAIESTHAATMETEQQMDGKPAFRMSAGEHPSVVPQFSDEESDILAARFAEQIPDKTFSMAQLQGYLMGFKYEPAKAIERASELLRGKSA